MHIKNNKTMVKYVDHSNTYEALPTTSNSDSPLSSISDSASFLPITRDMTYHLLGSYEDFIPEDGEEFDLHKHWSDCVKCPGHTQFKPNERLKTNQLLDLFHLIKRRADLSIRVEVRKIRPNRFDVTLVSKRIFSRSYKKGSINFPLGTGAMRQVLKFMTRNSLKHFSEHRKHRTHCRCLICQRSETSRNVCWEFSVVKADHVVYDDIVARHTTLTPFNDSDSSSEVIIDQSGIYEDFMPEDGEEFDLHKHWSDCVKCPGHTQFIPTERFEKNHLPEKYRNQDLFDFIKSQADLTVRVEVRKISPDRPDVTPVSKRIFPRADKKGGTNFRLGTGTMRQVFKFLNGNTHKNLGKHSEHHTHCWCTACQRSETPSNVWWEFNVETAAHVVYDDIEARHATLTLFYDSDSSSKVIIDKVSVIHSDVERDFSVLECVTCDVQLGEKLERVWKSFDRLWVKVYNQYKESSEAERLTFIVSHPHGSTKQISIGRWTEQKLVGQCYNRFVYTTCTCPGSSGAPVHVVGSNWWWRDQHVHSGTGPSGNYSGLGRYL
uniref:Uncharacterized protein n=1 Tax=Biomphalaria glabrata TaxID=6526 RepID=A0A2C9LES5_BIOGL